jgi:hypothetical protein
MLFEIIKTESGFSITSTILGAKLPSSMGLLEHDIETWLAEKPDLLLPNEQLLVIARSVAGQAMADILALDALGRLVIVEIKRDWADRSTVGQLLEYAAKSRSFEELQNDARRYFHNATYDLYEEYCRFSENSETAKVELGKSHRLFIVAPESDEGLRSIVDWLKAYNVPIELVPFTVYADSQSVPKYLQLEGVVTSPEVKTDIDSWAGHWIFNTNETYAPGAYSRMFEKNVAAVYGYTNGPANLEGASVGDVVLAYVNQQGIRAAGVVFDTPDVTPGSGIFLDTTRKQL